MNRDIDKVTALSLWSRPVEPQPLPGGITNRNFTVEDGDRKYVVRLGDDIKIHHVMRFNEHAASKAAHAAGISPEVIHTEPGILVLSFIEGETIDAPAIGEQPVLERILQLVTRCHKDIPRHLRGPALIFWVFHVLRDYGHRLKDTGSPHEGRLARFMDITERLESAVGPVDMVFGHNDLLAANFIDDGDRLWLIDWDYAGFNSPLFDLANLAGNNGLCKGREEWLLETYFDSALTDALWHKYMAMKCASLLRETMWSMVSELYSQIDFDYRGYSEENMAKFETAWRSYKSL